MDSSEFGKFSAARAATLTRYFNNEGVAVVARETLRFVDDNFRLQGWQGASFQPWKAIKRPGTILVKTGALRRSFNWQNRGNGEIYFYNNLPYAKAHNEGFKGAVNVRAHSRATYMKTKVSSLSTRKTKTVTTKVRERTVETFTRNMDLPRRQFAPFEGSESPVLNAAIIKQLAKDITNIFKY